MAINYDQLTQGLIQTQVKVSKPLEDYTFGQDVLFGNPSIGTAQDYIDYSTQLSSVALPEEAVKGLDPRRVNYGVEFNSKLIGSAYYFDEDVIDLVVSGVKEIVKNYGVDGIHFDDYFYPTTAESFDSSYYNKYKASGGKLSLSDWRRQNVNTLIKKVYSAIKSIDSGCRFGISPTGKMSSNYSSLYCDVYTWVTSSGYIDYICPQLYYGFNHGSLPYLSALSEFNDMITANGVELIVGLAGYKSGAADNYAGSGKNEWVENNDILSRQVRAARNEDNYGGFAIYRYDSIYNPASSVAEAVGKEYDSLKKYM